MCTFVSVPVELNVVVVCFVDVTGVALLRHDRSCSVLHVARVSCSFTSAIWL
jgi:hypothetical protein